LAGVQCQAIFELGERLKALSGYISLNQGYAMSPATFGRRNDALLEPDRIAGCDKIPICAPAFLQVALAQQLVDTVFDIGERGGQGKAKR
jgi:hypothetical protein